MSEPDAPTTEAVRLAYVDREDFLSQIARTERKDDAIYEAEFDRWLAKVKAEAWENGWNAYDDAINLADSREYPNPDQHPNPYEEERHVDQ